MACEPDLELTHGVVARALIEKYHVKYYGQKYYIYNLENKVGFRFEKGKIGYVEIGKEQLKSDIHKLYNKFKKQYKIEKEVKGSLVNEVLVYLENDGYINETKIDGDLIYVDNGILDTKSGELIKDDIDTFIPLRIPVPFNKKAISPRIDSFYKDITNNNEDDVLTLYEMDGYVLEPKYPIHKAVILTGEGHNGKNTKLNILSAFLGKKNISRINLYDFQDRFSIPELHNKLANIRGDLGHDVLGGHARGILKDLTGLGEEEEIATRRIRRDYFYFYNRAKFYYGCNMLPSIKLTDKAFIERWVIITLPNQYPDNDDFAKRLVVKDELSGLLNQAIEAKVTLKRQKKFTKTKGGQGYNELYELFKEAKIVDSRRVDEEDDDDSVVSGLSKWAGKK